MDRRHADASSLLVLEATGDSEAEHDTTTTTAVEHKNKYCIDVVAADDDAESCTGDQSLETMGVHRFEVGAEDDDDEEIDGQRSMKLGQEEEEEEEGVVDSWRRVQVREMKKEREEDRLFWERCLAMGFP